MALLRIVRCPCILVATVGLGSSDAVKVNRKHQLIGCVSTAVGGILVATWAHNEWKNMQSNEENKAGWEEFHSEELKRLEENPQAPKTTVGKSKLEKLLDEYRKTS